jgi:hypothetical protein
MLALPLATARRATRESSDRYNSALAILAFASARHRVADLTTLLQLLGIEQKWFQGHRQC